MNYRRVPVLLPGTYRLAPSARFPEGQVVKYSSNTAKHVVRQGNDQIKAGLVHPMCWMHDENAEPEYLSSIHDGAWVAKGYFGKARRFEVSGDGQAVAVVEIPDDKDANQFDKFGRVSPCLLNNWKDEKSTLWPGLSIIHIGATPTPIQRGIQKATPAYLSHSKSNPALRLRKSGMHWLSYPTTPRSESMAEETETEIDETKDVDGDGVADINEVTGDESVKKAVSYLTKHGILHLGNPKNWEEFQVALEAAVDTDMGGDQDGDGDMDADDAMANTEAVSQSPMMMSFYAKLAKVEEKEINQRMDELKNTGKIDMPTYKRLQKDVQEKVNLSHEPHTKFKKDGTTKRFDAISEIAAYEKLPAGKFQTKANLSNTAAIANKIKEDLDLGTKAEREEKEFEEMLKKNRGMA